MSKKGSSFQITVKDHLVTGESFELMFDPDLDMLQTVPAPSEQDLPKYYESDDYISHTDSRRGLMAFLYQKVKSYSLRKKVNLINRENGGTGTLLDVGAGTGAFLEAANKRGWNVKGVEPNEKARKFAGDRGLELVDSIEELDDSRYDVVTLWHVLEHMPNLLEVIQKLSSIVKPGGTLIVAVPNFKSYDARHYKNFWAAYDVPRHIWHFSRTAVKKLFADHFNFVKDRPMIFDSIYVSLLSEKYKSGKSFSMRAIWTGFVSNIKGLSSKEYSSHIYIFKRNN